MTSKEIKAQLSDEIKNSNISDKAINEIARILNREKMPLRVREAYDYIAQCESDMGFMGSPRYYEAKETVEKFKQSQQ